jgi:hypothetical protein
MYPPNTKGFHDVFGSVWEWCEDNFNGLPGGEKMIDYLYNDYSIAQYDGEHNLIIGGSWASNGATTSYFTRFAFRKHFHQLCGFRLTNSLPQSNPQINLVKDRIFVLGKGFPGNNCGFFFFESIKLLSAYLFKSVILKVDLFILIFTTQKVSNTSLILINI